MKDEEGYTLSKRLLVACAMAAVVGLTVGAVAFAGPLSGNKASVLPSAVRCLLHDPDKHVRARAVPVVGRWAHSDQSATAALIEARDLDPEPLVRKSAGWYCPDGPIYRRTAPK